MILDTLDSVKKSSLLVRINTICELLKNIPDQSRLVMEHLPDLAILDDEDLADIWAALVTPTTTPGTHNHAKAQRKKAIRHFLFQLKATFPKNWESQLYKMAARNEDPDQYPEIFSALTTEEDRDRFFKRSFYTLVDFAYKLPEVWVDGLQQAIDAAFAYKPSPLTPEDQEQLLRGWMAGSIMRGDRLALDDEKATANDLLVYLLNKGVDINLPHREKNPLKTLEGFYVNFDASTDILIDLLMVHGVDWESALDTTTNQTIKNIILDHPRARKKRLEDIAQTADGHERKPKI